MIKLDAKPGDTYYLVEETKISKCIFIGTHPKRFSISYLVKSNDPTAIIYEDGTIPSRVWTQDYEEAKIAMLEQAAKRWAEIKNIYHG